MKYSPDEKKIILNRKLNKLDTFVLSFTRHLDKYVVVSGYVSILFGRSRATEDIDLLIPKMSEQEFQSLWDRLSENDFECINTSYPEEAFKMLKEHAIRFSEKNKPIPNMEFKIIADEIGKYSFDNKIRVILDKGELFVSPLEMQIAYKLDLGKQGNEKDIEDAKHLYELFKEKLNNAELLKLINQLNVSKQFELIQ